MANSVKITSTDGISAAGGLSAGKCSYFANNVGIGTNIPTSFSASTKSLHVCGSNAELKAETNSGGGWAFSHYKSPEGSWTIGMDNTDIFRISNSNTLDSTTRFAIDDTTGYVGIGTTSPIATLHVAGSAYVASDTTVMGNLSVHGDLIYIDTAVTVTSALSVINTGTGPALYVEQEGVEPIAKFIDREGGEIHFTDTGKVGIGTGSPANMLEIKGPGSNVDVLNLNKGTGVGGLKFTFDGTNYVSYIRTYEASALSANYMALGVSTGNDVNGAEVMRLKGDGKVGIGTTEPATPLHVWSTSYPQFRVSYNSSLYFTLDGLLILASKIKLPLRATKKKYLQQRPPHYYRVRV